MNNVLFCLALIIHLTDTTSCRERFYEAATQDTSFLSSGFLKIYIVDSSNHLKTGLLLNQTFYLFMKRNKGLDYSEYRQFIKNFYESGKSLSYADFGELSYLLLRRDAYVDRIAKKGKKKFLSHFFKNKVFKYKYGRHFESVVARAFDYGILIAHSENFVPVIIFSGDCFQ
jgi:hypothetical protein